MCRRLSSDRRGTRRRRGGGTRYLRRLARRGGARRVILKIGGSVLTDKTTEETVAEGFDEVLSSVAGSAPEDLVLVHGAGSFGHPHAAATD